MVDTGYNEYHVTAPPETQTALHDEFHVIDEDDDGEGVTLIGPAGEDPGPLADTFPKSPVQEFMDDHDLDYGVMSSRPVRKPSDLPEALRDAKTVRDIIGDVAVTDLLEDALNGTDLREHSLQGRVRFDTGDRNLFPLSPATIQRAIDAGLTEDDPGPYPSAKTILEWNESLQTEFPDLQMRGVGFFQLPTKYWPEGQVMFDGAYLHADDDYPAEAVDWLRANCGNPNEFHEDTNGVRMWWD